LSGRNFNGLSRRRAFAGALWFAGIFEFLSGLAAMRTYIVPEGEIVIVFLPVLHCPFPHRPLDKPRHTSDCFDMG
jgi:hypothetical protein